MSDTAERVTLNSIQHLLARQGTEAFLTTLEIDHHTFDAPIRFINDNVDLTNSQGLLYIAYPFEAQLPDDVEDQVPTVDVKIGNVDERIIPALRGIHPPPPVVRMGIITRSDPDNPVTFPLKFEMTDVSYNAKEITGKLTYQFRANSRFPKDTMNPATCPGIF